MTERDTRERGGFWYTVSDDQLSRYAALTALERLTWLDEIRRFTLLAETPETAARRERLRAGLRIDEFNG